MDDRQLNWAWQQRTPRTSARPLGVILDGLAGAIWFKQQRHIGPIVRLLEGLLPPSLTSHLAVEGLRQNTLYLRVDSASHRYELELAKEALLEAVNMELSGIYIREIRLALGKLDGPPPPPRRAD